MTDSTRSRIPVRSKLSSTVRWQIWLILLTIATRAVSASPIRHHGGSSSEIDHSRALQPTATPAVDAAFRVTPRLGEMSTARSHRRPRRTPHSLNEGELRSRLSLLQREAASASPTCGGLISEMCQPCPQGGPQQLCDDIKQECTEVRSIVDRC